MGAKKHSSRLRPMENPHKLIIITTGGTIAKTYDEFDGSLSNKEAVIQRIISHLRLPYSDIHIFSILEKDSLSMTDKDRETLLLAVKNQLPKKQPIIVIHGTDTMAKSANYCFENLPDLEVPLIFSGAMKPFGFVDSDAVQNVTEALMAAKLLSPGVFISFHGNTFSLPNVRKNKEKRTFEAI
jgi:L-asparaginase